MHKSPVARSVTRLYTQYAEMLQELKKRAIKEFQIEVCACKLAVWCCVEAHNNTHTCVPTHYAQWPLLIARLKYIICGAIFQYVHGMFTQLAHRLHAPQKQPLPDLGFSLFPVWLRVLQPGTHKQRLHSEQHHPPRKTKQQATTPNSSQVKKHTCTGTGQKAGMGQ